MIFMDHFFERVTMPKKSSSSSSSKKKDVHVVPNPDGGWQVIREGASRASSNHETKANASAAGKVTAEREKVDLIEHNKDGKIARQNSYGNDPNPPKDKNR